MQMPKINPSAGVPKSIPKNEEGIVFDLDIGEGKGHLKVGETVNYAINLKKDIKDVQFLWEVKDMRGKMVAMAVTRTIQFKGVEPGQYQFIAKVTAPDGRSSLRDLLVTVW
jgi:hypothetical protein